MSDAETGERNKRFLWRCRDCRKQYTVRIGTVFEDRRQLAGGGPRGAGEEEAGGRVAETPKSEGAKMSDDRDDVRAFPFQESGERANGMALRDYFAAAALTGLLIKGVDDRQAVSAAFTVADLMMKHRND